MPTKRIIYHVPRGALPCLEELRALRSRCPYRSAAAWDCDCDEEPPRVYIRRSKWQPPRAKSCTPKNHFCVSQEPMEEDTVYNLSYRNNCEAKREPIRPKDKFPPFKGPFAHETVYKKSFRDPCCDCASEYLSRKRSLSCHDVCWRNRERCGKQPRDWCSKREPILPRNHLHVPSGSFATSRDTTHNMSYQPWICEELYYCY